MTLGWVHWHITQRFHGYLGDVLPAEFEQMFYAGLTASPQLVGIKKRESPSGPERFTVDERQRASSHLHPPCHCWIPAQSLRHRPSPLG